MDRVEHVNFTTLNPKYARRRLATPVKPCFDPKKVRTYSIEAEPPPPKKKHQLSTRTLPVPNSTSLGMAWPYQFIHADDALREKRRALLDRYGVYAQVLPWIIMFIILAARLMRHASKRWANAPAYATATYSPIPSPTTARTRKIAATSWTSKRQRQVLWWMKDPVELAGLRLGQRGGLILGSLWATWLLFLCVNGTSNGRLRRRFSKPGIVQG